MPLNITLAVGFDDATPVPTKPVAVKVVAPSALAARRAVPPTNVLLMIVLNLKL